MKTLLIATTALGLSLSAHAKENQGQNFGITSPEISKIPAPQKDAQSYRLKIVLGKTTMPDVMTKDRTPVCIASTVTDSIPVYLEGEKKVNHFNTFTSGKQIEATLKSEQNGLVKITGTVQIGKVLGYQTISSPNGPLEVPTLSTSTQTLDHKLTPGKKLTLTQPNGDRLQILVERMPK